MNKLIINILARFFPPQLPDIRENVQNWLRLEEHRYLDPYRPDFLRDSVSHAKEKS